MIQSYVYRIFWGCFSAKCLMKAVLYNVSERIFRSHTKTVHHSLRHVISRRWTVVCVVVTDGKNAAQGYSGSSDVFHAVYRFRGDLLLEPSDRVGVTKEAEKHVLTLNKVLKAEEGVVNVKATNEVGQMSASARLKVAGTAAAVAALINGCVWNLLTFSVVFPQF